MITENIYIDPLTHMPNYIKFMAEDFKSIFGQEGCIVQVKVKPLRLINDQYGQHIGDEFLKFAGDMIKRSAQDYPYYRHEGNGFILILKDKNCTLARKLMKDLNEGIKVLNQTLQVEEAFIQTMVFEYNQPIESIADFYMLLLDEYKKQFKDASHEELIHHILNVMNHRMSDSVNKYIQTHEYALHDDISNLPNSKSAKLLFENIDQRYNRYAVLFIDGDSLSKFNKVSYDEGNYAIRRIAEVISSSIRKTDHVYRWLSGDEFIVVTENITDGQVEKLAERIRKNIEKAGHNMMFPATVSIGVACCPHDGADIDDILKCAELANKEAKANGKNMVMYYDESEISQVYN